MINFELPHTKKKSYFSMRSVLGLQTLQKPVVISLSHIKQTKNNRKERSEKVKIRKSRESRSTNIKGNTF